MTDKASAQGSSGSGMKKNLRSDKYFPRNEEEKERWQERLLRWREEHHLNNPPKQMKSTDRKMFRAFKPYGHHVKNMFRKRLSTTQSKQKQVRITCTCINLCQMFTNQLCIAIFELFKQYRGHSIICVGSDSLIGILNTV